MTPPYMIVWMVFRFSLDSRYKMVFIKVYFIDTKTLWRFL